MLGTSSAVSSSAAAAAPDVGGDAAPGPTKALTLVAAINEALHTALEADDTACCFGEDVSFGGVFRATVGLQERFGQARVFNTPLSEQARGHGSAGLRCAAHPCLNVQEGVLCASGFDRWRPGSLLAVNCGLSHTSLLTHLS